MTGDRRRCCVEANTRQSRLRLTKIPNAEDRKNVVQTYDLLCRFDEQCGCVDHTGYRFGRPGLIRVTV